MIQFEEKSQTGIVILNRPKALNSLNFSMIKAFHEQLKAWEENNSIQAVLIQSASEKFFCAGGDVRELYEGGKHQLGEGNPKAMQFFQEEYALNALIAGFKKPYFALMNGLTMGGGVGISLHGAYPIASESFEFAMPETAIGFFPDIGASYLLSRCIAPVGVYLALTGRRLKAADVFYLGFVSEVIKEEAREACAEALLKLANSGLSSTEDERIKEKVAFCLAPFLATLPPSELEAELPLIQEYFSFQRMEDIVNGLQASKDPWALKQLERLKKSAPLSLKVTLAQMQKAAGLSLQSCLDLDYCLAGHFMRDHDFYEGVRALLVDKDQSPHWQPQALLDVSQEQVFAYFQALAQKDCQEIVC